MTSNFPRRSLRRRAVWGVPVLTCAVIAGGVLVSSPASSSPHPSLPARTAGQLLTAVQSSESVPLSGTVVETARLGLPALPSTGGASLSWQSLVTGSHTALLWSDGPQKQRLALTGELSESDVIHNGRDLWTYTSASNEVTHTLLSANAAKELATRPDTPAAAAAAALKAIDPTTRVTVDRTQIVAGQKAYTLVLTPRDGRSTVRKVTIALDSKHFVPLRVQVFGAAKAPALEAGFTSVKFRAPAASVFDFRTPKGATVGPNPVQPRVHVVRRPGSGPGPAVPRADGKTRVIGTGWTAILESTGGIDIGSAGGLLNKASQSVGSNGARLITTALLNALVLPDGRVFVGAVEPSLLESTAAATPR